MTGTIAKVLSTALDRTHHFPLFKPSRRDVRNLFDALEDLVLPMGSFHSEDLHPWAPEDPVYDPIPNASPLSTMPSSGSTGSEHLFNALEDLVLPMGSFTSEDLHPWAPTDRIYDSNSNPSPLSTTPSPGSTGSGNDGESLPPKPTLGGFMVKHLSSALSTKSTLRTARPKSTVMRSSALPTRSDSASAPSTKSASTGRTPIGGQSNAAVKSASVTSMHGDHASTPVDKLPRTGQPTSDAALTTTSLPSPTNLIPTNGRISGLEDSPEETFDSLEFQQAPEDDSCDAGSAVEVPLPEQTVVEANTIGSGSIAVGEEGQKEQQDEDSTAVVKKVSTGTQTTQQQVEDSIAAVEKVPTGSLVLFENAVRELVDTEGASGPDLQKLVELVADIMKQRIEAEENLKSTTVRSKRAEEDLRHWWEDLRGVFERIISGQNKALQWNRDKSHELKEENRKLKLEHSVDEDKRKDTLDQYNARLRTLKAEKKIAEETAKTAKAEAVDRINVLRENYENEKLAAEDKHMHERNSLVSSRRMVRNDLNGARRQLTVAVEEHQVAIKDKDQTIQGLEATIRQIRSTVTTSEELAADKRHLEKQLKDQRKEKDSEIGTLTDQLRDSKAVVKSLSGWKDMAEAEKQNRIRLSERLEDETRRLREEKKHIVDQKDFDIRGLDKTIQTKEADISRLEGMITSLEAGEEKRGLKSQLEESKKQLRVSAKDMEDMKQQLQDCQRETEELKRTIKARDKNISEEAEKASKEKEELKIQLEQTTRVSEEGLKEKVRELGEQKDDLARKLEIAQSAEQTVRTDMQRLHDENGQTAAEHERMLKEMYEEIHRLQVDEQAHEERKKTAVEDAVGKIIGEAQRKIGELEREKAAIEGAAKEAAEGVRQTLQKQLDDERQFREAQEKATATENELRNEMAVLKSLVNNVEESHSTNPAGPEAGKEAQIVEELVKQANDANDLLLEIGTNGVAKKSVEQTVLCQLNDAKIALHRVKDVLLEPPARYHRGRLVKIIDGVNVNEERIAQLPIDSALVSQAKMANARLRRLEKILDANADVQRDAMLEALHTATPFEREIRKPRALRRPAKPSPSFDPSTGGQTDVSMGQSQQMNGAPEQQYDPRFPNLQQNAQPQVHGATPQDQMQAFAQTQSGGPTNRGIFQPGAKAAFDVTSVGGAPAASDNPPFQPFAMGDAGTGGPSTPKNNTQNSVSPNKPMVVRDHRPPFMDLLNSLKPAAVNNTSGAMPAVNAPPSFPSLQSDRQASASMEESKKDHENQVPEMPEGWTDEMTGTVKAMHGEDNMFIEEMVKELHGLQVKDAKGLEAWLNKLQSDHEAEMNPDSDLIYGRYKLHL